MAMLEEVELPQPTDAIALALTAGVPVLVEPEVLESAPPPREWEAEADEATDDRRVLADEVRQRVTRP